VIEAPSHARRRPAWRFRLRHFLLVMEYLERISIEPTIRSGKACVRSTRLMVGEVLGYLAGGTTEAKLFADFPQLTHEDGLACFAFAAASPAGAPGRVAPVRLLLDEIYPR